MSEMNFLNFGRKKWQCLELQLHHTEFRKVQIYELFSFRFVEWKVETKRKRKVYWNFVLTSFSLAICWKLNDKCSVLYWNSIEELPLNLVVNPPFYQTAIGVRFSILANIFLFGKCHKNVVIFKINCCLVIFVFNVAMLF